MKNRVARCLALFVALSIWASFVVWGHKSYRDYLFPLLPEIAVGKLYGWDSRDLFFSQWSHPEGEFRWSDGRNPEICWRSSAQIGDKARVRIELNLNLIESLKNESVVYKINRKEGVLKKSIEGLYVIDEMGSDVADSAGRYCLTLNLPHTVSIRGDQRKLGVQLLALRYSIDP